MTAPALPPEVEKALEAALNAAHDLGEVESGHPLFNDRVDADIKAEDALRTAIARALGGDGEPVAWGVFLCDQPFPYAVKPTKEEAGRYAMGAGLGRTVRPLFTRPAATTDLDTVGDGGTPMRVQHERLKPATADKIDPDEPIKCGTFGGVTIPPHIRARMDADRAAAKAHAAGAKCPRCGSSSPCVGPC